MKRILLTLMLAIAVATTASAQTDGQQRQKWFEEMRRYKSEYIADKLKLDEKQKAEFTPIYEDMDSEIGRLNHEMRQLERNIKKNGEKVTDTEYEKAAEAQFEIRAKEAAIERSYFPKFKQILTPRQLYELKNAERDFNRNLMEKHRRAPHSKKR